MKRHNFSAGPAILPREVIEESAQAVLDFNGMGLSLLEISHRSKPFMAVMEESEQLVRELLSLSDDYGVMFLSGGASTQFFMVPMNLLDNNGKAVYIDTGVWASKAIKEAINFGDVEVIASSKPENYNHIPLFDYVPGDASYLHITSNNTIYGTQYHNWPETTVPMVCDMSSDIFSRPVPTSNFGLIYAGAQKNMGPAGTTLVIVKKELLGKVTRKIPSMLDYRIHIENGSMYNTPPVFPIYVSMLTMRWVKKMGGLNAMEARNNAKAALLYNEIDENPLFKGTVDPKDRSAMNICFLLNNAALDKEFMELTACAGIEGILGHRSVGGFRASVYNAMPIESVQVLVDVMRDFANRYSA
jgi:phosphoserine aminotransferase